MLSLVHVGHSYWHPFTATSPIMPEEFGEHLTPQLHVGASSLQFTSLIFCRVQIRGLGWPCKKLHFVLILMFVWIIVLIEDRNKARYKISNRGSQVLIFYLLVFDRIHDAMHLNKMSRTSGRKNRPTTLKIQQYI